MAERGRPRSFNRADALRRAMEVFWAKGYGGASLSDLTAAMGINSPSLYAAFGCKEALFREAVELYGVTEGGRIWDGMAGAPSARAGIETMLHASAEELTRPGRPHGCLVVLGTINADGVDQALGEEMRQQRAHGGELIRTRLARAVSDGELPHGLDLRTIATFYTTVQQGMSIQARDGATRKALLAVADCAMAAWDSLVTPPDRRKA